jgi:hypothetical protein
MQPIIIKNRNVRLERKTLRCTEEKAVRLLEDEGAVVAIELSCSCGEVTVVELEYAETPPTEPKP